NFALKAVAVALFIMLGINGYIFLTDANLIGGAKISTTGINSWFDSLIATDHKQVEVTPNEVITNVLVPETSIDSVTPIEDNSTIAPEEITSTQVTEETNNANLNIAQVFAHTNKEAPTVGTNKFNDNGELVVAETPQPTQPEEIKTTTTNTKAEVNINSTTQVSFHVIGGVFCNEKNARKFYKLLKSKGFDAELLLNKKINCNRVSYRKVSTREEAYQLMDSIKTTENPEAWVLAVKE
nr:SPOR domain-containing protein [Bacteroidia bacterium]